MDCDRPSDKSTFSSPPPSLDLARSSFSPSSPLSEARSISPPPTYQVFTPPASQNADEEIGPARKRRKIERPVRTTRHLDLTSETAQSIYDRDESMEFMLRALRKRRKIVVVAGAGISVSAGIPDFRSSHGLFRSLRGEHKLKSSGKELFDASVYKDDDSTSTFHDMVRKLSRMASNAKPTRFHQLLARLATEGRLLRLYTQNVDGLETELPPLATQIPLNHRAPWPATIQVHGSLEKMICQKCRTISDFMPHLFEGPVPPSCPDCIAHDQLRTEHAGKRSHGVGKLRPRMVLYNEQNPDEDAIGAVIATDLRTRPDAVLVVGTSMKIPAVRRIVREMCKVVRDRKEGTTMWINRDPEPSGSDLDNLWDLVVKGDSDEVARLANFPDWDDEAAPVLAEPYTDSDVERIKSCQGPITVEVKKPKKNHLLGIGLGDETMTPPMSPNHKLVDADVDVGQHNSITVEIPSQPQASTAEKNNINNAVKVKFKLKLKNPASDGPKLSKLISNSTEKVKSKTSLNRKLSKSTARTVKTQSILTGRITKPAAQHGTVTTKKQEPLSALQNINTAPSSKLQIMQSATSLDGEGCLRPATPPGLMARTPPEMRDFSSHTSPRIKHETVSPKSVPNGMAALLD